MVVSIKDDAMTAVITPSPTKATSLNLVEKDEQYLHQIGKTQELKRTFGSISMVCLVISLQGTWEALIGVLSVGLISGGPVALVYGYIIAMLGTLATAMSLGEIASMWPTSGGQYHWVAELAPKRWKPLFSYVSGWITVAGWQSLSASTAFTIAVMTQSLIAMNHPEYIPQRWHGTLLYWAVLWFAVFANVFMIKILPKIEMAAAGLHILLFVAFLVTICVMGTPATAEFVFASFDNNSGWSSDGVAWCIGLLSSCFVFLGYDGAAHMSEELHNPARAVPRAMFWSIVINGILGFGWLIAVLFFMGDLLSVVDTPFGYPMIQIFYNITGTVGGATAMSSLVVFMAGLATIPLLASTSRTTWAFARDEGIPFSKYFSHVNRRFHLPVRAVLLSVALQMLLGLVNIGSTTAFSAFLALASVALYISYLLPLPLMVYRRIYANESLQYGPYTLGVFGLPLNIVAILFTVWTSVFMLFPNFQPVTAANMNYAVVVLGTIIIICFAYWGLRGRKSFSGPITSS